MQARVFVLIWLFACTALAFADGMFAKLASAIEPTLPYQRAIIAHRNGVETMFVESVVGGQGTYAWILPVPEKPISIEPGNSLTLDMVARTMRPAYLASGPEGLESFSWIFGLLFAAITIQVLRKKNNQKSALHLLLGVIALFLLGLVFFPVFAQSKSGSRGNTFAAVPFGKIGNYDVTLLQGRDSNGITKWLKSHGGDLPPNAVPIVTDYVREDWCFLAATLTLTENGYAAPHPLIVRFPTPKPIFPMRLTATHGKPVIVDLFVLGDGTAESSPLHKWVSRDLRRNELPNPKPNRPILMLSDLSWEGAKLTRLRGEVKPEHMTSDLEIKMSFFKPMQLRVGKMPDLNSVLSTAFLVASITASLIVCVLLWLRQPRAVAGIVATTVGLIVFVSWWAVSSGSYHRLEGDLVTQGPVPNRTSR
jgi:hypothetical protein